MTQDQVMAMARQLLPIVGTLMTTLGVSAVTAHRFVDLLLATIGPAFVLGSAVWSFIANSKKSILISAAQMPEVKSIKLEDSAPAEMVNTTPMNVTKEG